MPSFLLSWIIALCSLGTHASLSELDASDSIYIVGGTLVNGGGAANAVSIYSLQTNQWTMGTPMSSPRNCPGVVSLNNTIYAIGGGYGVYLNTAESFDTMDPTSSWRSIAPLSIARQGIATTTSFGYIYAIGGAAVGGTVTNVDRYEPTTNMWTSFAPTNYPRAYAGVATAPNGNIYLFGGLMSRGGESTYLKTIEWYNPRSNQWTMSAMQMSVATAQQKAMAIGSAIYVLGPGSTVQAYIPTLDLLLTLSPMSTSRSLFGAAASQGYIYAIGGTPDFSMERLGPFPPGGGDVVLPIKGSFTNVNCFGTVTISGTGMAGANATHE